MVNPTRGIDPADDAFMFKAFKSRCAKRLQDMYSDIREGRDQEHRWMTEANLQVLREYWRSEKFLEKSAKNKMNRASLRGGSLHCGGSSSTESTRQRMSRLLSRPPTQGEVFKETHTRNGQKHVWVDQRSELTYAEYNRLLEEARSQQTQHTETGEPIECPPIDEDLVWNQTVGGPSNKNRIYGKGTYYADRLSVSSETGGSTSVVHDDVRERVQLLNSELYAQAQAHQRQMETLQQHVMKLEEERKKEKERNEKEKKRLKMELRKEMMEMRKGMFEYTKNIQAGSSNPIPPVMDDDGDSDDVFTG